MLNQKKTRLWVLVALIALVATIGGLLNANAPVTKKADANEVPAQGAGGDTKALKRIEPKLGSSQIRSLVSSPSGSAYCSNLKSTALPSSGTVVYVSPTGSDSTGTGTVGNPWLTLSGRTLTDGTTVVFRGGTWTSWPYIAWGAGNPAATNITLRNYPGEVPIINDGTFFMVLYGSTANHITVSGLTFHNFSGNGSGVIVGTSGVNSTSGAPSYINIRCNFFDRITNGHGVYIGGDGYVDETNPTSVALQTSHDWNIEYNDFKEIDSTEAWHTGANLTQAAIHSFHANEAYDVAVRGNTFLNVEYGVLTGNEGSRNWTVENNSFYDAKYAIGLTTYENGCVNAAPCPTTADSSGWIIRKNVAYVLPGQYALKIDDDWNNQSPLKFTESNNDWYAPSNASVALVGYVYGGFAGTPYTLSGWQSYGATKTPVQGTGDISVDPQFANGSGGDFVTPVLNQISTNGWGSQPTSSAGNFTASKILGVPWSGDSLGRIVITNYSKTAQLFTAQETSTITSIHQSLIGCTQLWNANADENTCYAAGTGGTIRADVWPDDGTAAHLPNMTGSSLGWFQWVDPLSQGTWWTVEGHNNNGYLGELKFSGCTTPRRLVNQGVGSYTPTANPAGNVTCSGAGIPVTAGQRYHVVWSNPSANAATNWYGVNYSTTRQKQFAEGPSQQTAILPSSEWDTKYMATSGGATGSYSTGGAWESCTDQTQYNYCYIPTMFFSAVMAIKYSSGNAQGNAYETYSPDPSLIIPNVSATSSTRQSIIVSSTQTVSGISVSIAPKTAGVMTAKLVNNSNSDVSATLTKTFALSAGLQNNGETCSPYPVSTGSAVTCSQNAQRKVLSFASPVTLTAGTYYIQFGATSGEYGVTMSLPDQEFPSGSYYPGAAYFTYGTGWSGAGNWDVFTYLVPYVAPVVTGTISTTNSIIGLPWSGDATTRMIVRDYSQVDHVWVAPKTGSIARVQIAGTGAYDAGPGYTGTDENADYASGTGGIYRLDIYADDGAGNATGPSLASYQKGAGCAVGITDHGCYVNGKNPTGFQTDSELRLLASPLSVTAGQKFHNIWTNPDPNSTVNWWGINNFSTRAKDYSEGAAVQTHLLPSSEWDVRYKATSGPYSTSGAWRSCADQTQFLQCGQTATWYTPMNVLYYSDYTLWGDPYFGPALNPEDYTPNVTTTNSERQTLTVLNSTTVSGIEVSVAAKTAGVMTARITDMSGNTITGATATSTVSLSPALLPSYITNLTCNPYPSTPVTCTTNTIRKYFTFSLPVTLAPGSYAIEFTASSGSFALAIVKPDRGFYATFGPGSGDRGEAQFKPSGGTWTVIPYGNASTSTSFDIFTALTPVNSTPSPPTSSEQLYSTNAVPPTTIAIGSVYAVSVGQRINFNCSGSIDGVWWYRTIDDTGTITVSAWNSGGSLVAQGSGNPAITSGWAFLPFSSSLAVSPGQQLIVTVHHPNGAYGYTNGGTVGTGFNGRSITSASGCMTSPASNSNNGLYNYSSTPVLPTLTYQNTEYWLSPQFQQAVVTTTTTTAAPTTTTTAAPTTTTTAAPTTTTTTTTAAPTTTIPGPTTTLVLPKITFNVSQVCPIPTFIVTTKAKSGTTATLTTSTNHGLLVGSMISVVGVGSPFDGFFPITAVSSNTISYTTTSGTVVSTASTGTVSSLSYAHVLTANRAPSTVNLVTASGGTTSTIPMVASNSNLTWTINKTLPPGNWVMTASAVFTVGGTKSASIYNFSFYSKRC